MACWAADPKARPSFKAAVVELEKLVAQPVELLLAAGHGEDDEYDMPDMAAASTPTPVAAAAGFGEDDEYDMPDTTPATAPSTGGGTIQRASMTRQQSAYTGFDSADADV